ncbi:hypothetical protein BH11CYA1_BH11CYA1_30590 [soil metagenome]
MAGPLNSNSMHDPDQNRPLDGASQNPSNGTSKGAANNALNSETGPIANAAGQSETWSTMHILSLDSTKISSQAQTASLPMGRGMTKIYSTGDIVDNSYRLLALLGTGGMGVVFHCQHIILGKEYALKLLAGDKLSSESWTRFQSEAKALARLHHPGVVGIHNMGIDAEECPYYVMDLLEGESLSQMVRAKHRLPEDQALSIFIQLADALDSAHQQGIIHRDIKPSNVMVLHEGKLEKVKLVDFGIARLSDRGVGKNFASLNKTAAGTVFGTPYYMSPEQSLGQGVDHRSDIYSLGCALFEALTGVPPFCGTNAFETIMMHQTTEAPSLKSVYPQGGFSDSLEYTVAKMLNKSTKDRYQSMKQIAHDLSRIKEGKSIGLANVHRSSPSPVNPYKPKSNLDADYKNTKVEKSSKEEFSQQQKKTMFAAIATSAVLLAGALGLVIAAKNTYQARSSSGPVSKTATTTQVEEQEDDTGDFQLNNMRRYLKKNKSLSIKTENKNGEQTKQFIFPNNDYLGYIRVGDKLPQKATNTLEMPANEKVSLYLQCVCTPFPQICEKFGKDTITGLEIVTFEPAKVIQSLKSWSSLRHLSFFNSLERVAGIDCSTLAAEDIPLVDQLTQLKSLGLSGELSMDKPAHGQEITGAAILKLNLLHQLNSLQLKEIKDIQPLLKEIANYKNLTDLTLVGLDITDADLNSLIEANNISTLRIYQCKKITPQSAATICKMKGLKCLVVDTKWPQIATNQLKIAGKEWQFADYKKGAYN